MNSSQHRDIARAATAAAYFLAGECYERASSDGAKRDVQYQASWFQQYVGALRVAHKMERFCG